MSRRPLFPMPPSLAIAIVCLSLWFAHGYAQVSLNFDRSSQEIQKDIDLVYEFTLNLHNLADLYYEQGVAFNNEKNLVLCRKALEKSIKYRLNAEGTEFSEKMAATHLYLGMSLNEQGKYNEAIVHLRSSMDILETIGMEKDFKFATGYASLASALKALGQFAEAEKAALSALEGYKQLTDHETAQQRLRFNHR